MPVLRQVVGDTLRAVRMRQRRTLREVSATARVSLGYLSEIERGQKEPSSELLAAICAALDVRLSDLFAEVSDTMRRDEKRAAVAPPPAGQYTSGNSRRNRGPRSRFHVTSPARTASEPRNATGHPGTTVPTTSSIAHRAATAGPFRPPRDVEPAGDRMQNASKARHRRSTVIEQQQRALQAGS